MMHKTTRSLLCGLLAVAVLGGIYAALTRMPEPKDTETTDLVSILDLETDALASVQVSLPSEEYTVSFLHDESGDAYAMHGGAQDEAYDQTLLQELMDTARSISARPLEEHCTDPAKYGLDNRSGSLTITDIDNNTTVLTFGRTSEVLEGTYFTTDADDTVYLMDAEAAAILLRRQADYRELLILGNYYSLSSELQSLTVERMADGTTVSLAARDLSGIDSRAQESYSSFVFTQPLSCDADDDTLRTGILSDLQDALTARSIVIDDPSDLSVYGLDAPQARLHLTSNALDAVLLVGAADDDGGIYLMKEGGSTVYLSEAAYFGFLREDWNDWRSTDLFPFALCEVQSITLTQGNDTHTVRITHVPADENEEADTETETGTLDGEQLSDTALQQLSLALGSVHAVRFLTEPETAEPELTVTLTMTDGSVRSLAFAAGAPREYLANVSGSGFLYAVRQSDVTDILRAFQTAE